MKQRKLMNKREEKLMNFLWEQQESVTIADMEQYFASEKLNKTTIFKAVQSLMGLGYICVSGVERSNKTYARQFRAAVTREEYAAIILAERGIETSSLGNLAMAMLGNDKSEKEDEDADEKLINELESIILQLRNRQK